MPWRATQDGWVTVKFSSVHSFSGIQLFATPWTEHARLPCSLPSPRVCSNSYPLYQWCHPTILPSVISFSSCLQSFPSSGSFPTNRLFPSDGQSIGASASASVLPMNIQLFSFRIQWFDLAVQGTLKSLLLDNNLISSLMLRLFYGPALTSIHDYWKKP